MTGSGISPALQSSSSLADYFNDALLHWNRIQTAVSRAAHYLIQQEMHKVFIGDEAPQVHLQVVAINLDLLKPVAAKRAQPDALQESL